MVTTPTVAPTTKAALFNNILICYLSLMHKLVEKRYSFLPFYFATDGYGMAYHLEYWDMQIIGFVLNLNNHFNFN